MLKNLFITSLITLILIQPALASGSYKKLNFNNAKPDPQASKILYEYVLQEQKMTPEKHLITQMQPV
ncbi:hypothetical protein DBY21_09995 [Candidatus Gastranaerophilales bacterium]|nr:MAG: hypothetical protein DBY21_09995 [Candidatus Gastranaerophilales bacterium]